MAAKKSKTPEVTFENGRWAVGNYSTSVPNKLINHLRKKYQVDISIKDVLAMTEQGTAVAEETPETPDDNKES